MILTLTCVPRTPVSTGHVVLTWLITTTTAIVLKILREKIVPLKKMTVNIICARVRGNNSHFIVNADCPDSDDEFLVRIFIVKHYF